MASTYSTNLAIELIGTGDQAGTWGNTTNTNLGTLIEQAISGYVTQAVSTGTDTTITIPNGATGVARNMYIELTGTGGTNTNLIVPANKKLYFIFNNASGAVTVKVSGQTGVSVPAGKKVVLASNGTDTVNALNYIADFGSNSATITQLTATSATITNLTLTSLVISNLSIASANVTVLTSASATITNLSAASGTITTGNLTFSSTAQRITGDFSNATPANRVAFQSSTTNGNTNVMVLPNGTGTVSGVVLESSSDLNSSSNTQLLVINGSDSRITSGIRGTGTYLPMTFYTGGSERARIDTSGNVGIGTASPGSKLQLDFSSASTTLASSPVLTLKNTSFTNNCVTGILAQNSVGGNACGIDFINVNQVVDGSGASGSVGIWTNRSGTKGYNIFFDNSGNVGIGGTAGASEKVAALGTYPSSGGNSFVFSANGTIPSSSSINGINFFSVGKTQAASFTLSALSHFYAQQGTFGAGSTVTSQYGFYVESSLTGATNNYGFYSNIASGSNRWNFYAAGTAQNYFAGNVGIGTTSPSEKLDVAAAGKIQVLRSDNARGGQFFADNTGTHLVALAAGNDPLYLEALGNTGDIRFTTSSSERARIASGGQFSINTTNTSGILNVDGQLYLFNLASGAGNSTLKYNSGTGQVTYDASSRLIKENIVDSTYGLAEVLQLKSRKYFRKDDQREEVGFVADEVQEVLPEFVPMAPKSVFTGNKEDTELVPSSVNYDKLTSVLVKAIQELKAELDATKAEVAALKGA